MTKGAASMGRKAGKDVHVPCRRCGKSSFHKINGVCSSCGYGKSAKLRAYTWQKPGKRRM